MPWMTLEDEAALVDQLTETGRVAVDVLGHSVGGVPIRLLRIGDPPPAPGARAAVLLIGSQHGDEPAGREGLLQLATELANGSIPALEPFLASHGVHIVPTINPDGIATDTRQNGNGADLNRDWLALAQPEVRAVSLLMGRIRPLIVVDHHEAYPQLSANVTFAVPSSSMTDPAILARSEDLVAAAKADMVANSWTVGDYYDPGTPAWCVPSAGLRHAVAMLVETSRSQPDATRVEQQRLCALAAITLAEAEMSGLEMDAAEAAARATAAGAAGDPLDLGEGGIVDPAPLGYQLSGILPETHLAAFGINTIGARVPMSQPARAIIAYLLDEDSPLRVIPGVRLWTLPVPVVIATPQDFAPVVSGSHTLLTHVRLVTGFPSGYDPDGVDMPVVSGAVELDATADVFATLDLVIPGVDPVTGRPWFPRRAVDTLAPYGAELFVRVGVDLGDRTLWSPLGYFRIDDLDQSDASDGPIRISGSDRMAGIIDARLVEPVEFGRSATYAQVVTALVQDTHPLAVVAFDDDSGDRSIGRRLIVEEDRYEALRDLAESLGKLVWWDGEGILRVADAPDATAPVWHIRAGRHGVLVSAQRRVTRQGIYNAVVAQGEATSGAPARAVVADDGPRSPTRWGGPFGKVPRFYSSPLLTTRGQARAAAASILRRSLGMPYSVSLGAVTNPALRPHDPILVTLRDGSRDLHIVDTMSIPLTAGGGPMQLSTRSMADVRLGELDG